ncbi:MAG: hypothetical protein IJJ45_06760 [Clostridia bacterium]|nr:hypothetical protein [Clostridia bacterium]
MIVQKTSVFPADRDAVFQSLLKPATLQYIARPYVAFDPVEGASVRWTAGSTSAYRLRLFGRIPFGTHTIHIVRSDPEGISSREGNEHVPVWDHDIRLRRLDDGRTEYTDRVEIRAGWKTWFVWLWASAFYAHRQRRWIRLLEENRGGTTGIPVK